LTTRLILIRHGETDWNIEGRWQGQIDVALNARGQKQVEEMAQQLVGCVEADGLSAIYSSDLARARQTARALARMTGLPLYLDERLREIHQGEWQGLLVSEIQGRYAEEFKKRKTNPLSVAPPGGETARQVQERVIQATEEILSQHHGETVAVVSHGFAIAVILTHYRGYPFEKVWDLIPGNGKWEIIDVPDHPGDGGKENPGIR
jgi:broad specificity phosphatase PhoE